MESEQIAKETMDSVFVTDKIDVYSNVVEKNSNSGSSDEQQEIESNYTESPPLATLSEERTLASASAILAVPSFSASTSTSCSYNSPSSITQLAEPCANNIEEESSLLASSSSTLAAANELEQKSRPSMLYKWTKHCLTTVEQTMHEAVNHILFTFSLPRSGSAMCIFVADSDPVCLLWYILALLCAFLELHFWRSQEYLLSFRPVPMAMFMSLLRIILVSVDDLYWSNSFSNESSCFINTGSSNNNNSRGVIGYNKNNTNNNNNSYEEKNINNNNPINIYNVRTNNILGGASHIMGTNYSSSSGSGVGGNVMGTIKTPYGNYVFTSSSLTNNNNNNNNNTSSNSGTYSYSHARNMSTVHGNLNNLIEISPQVLCKKNNKRLVPWYQHHHFAQYSPSAFALEQLLWFILIYYTCELELMERATHFLFVANTLRWMTNSELFANVATFAIALAARKYFPVFGQTNVQLSFTSEHVLPRYLYAAYALSLSITLSLTEMEILHEWRGQVVEFVQNIPWRIANSRRSKVVIKRAVNVISNLYSSAFAFADLYFFLGCMFWWTGILLQSSSGIPLVEMLATYFTFWLFSNHSESISLWTCIRKTTYLLIFYLPLALFLYLWIPLASVEFTSRVLQALACVLYISSHRRLNSWNSVMYFVLWLAMIALLVGWSHLEFIKLNHFKVISQRVYGSNITRATYNTDKIIDDFTRILNEPLQWNFIALFYTFVKLSTTFLKLLKHECMHIVRINFITMGMLHLFMTSVKIIFEDDMFAPAHERAMRLARSLTSQRAKATLSNNLNDNYNNSLLGNTTTTKATTNTFTSNSNNMNTIARGTNSSNTNAYHTNSVKGYNNNNNNNSNSMNCERSHELLQQQQQQRKSNHTRHNKHHRGGRSQYTNNAKGNNNNNNKYNNNNNKGNVLRKEESAKEEMSTAPKNEIVSNSNNVINSDGKLRTSINATTTTTIIDKANSEMRNESKQWYLLHFLTKKVSSLRHWRQEGQGTESPMTSETLSKTNADAHISHEQNNVDVDETEKQISERLNIFDDEHLQIKKTNNNPLIEHLHDNDNSEEHIKKNNWNTTNANANIKSITGETANDNNNNTNIPEIENKESNTIKTESDELDLTQNKILAEVVLVLKDVDNAFPVQTSQVQELVEPSSEKQTNIATTTTTTTAITITSSSSAITSSLSESSPSSESSSSSPLSSKSLSAISNFKCSKETERVIEAKTVNEQHSELHLPALEVPTYVSLSTTAARLKSKEEVDEREREEEISVNATAIRSQVRNNTLPKTNVKQLEKEDESLQVTNSTNEFRIEDVSKIQQREEQTELEHQNTNVDRTILEDIHDKKSIITEEMQSVAIDVEEEHNKGNDKANMNSRNTKVSYEERGVNTTKEREVEETERETISNKSEADVCKANDSKIVRQSFLLLSRENNDQSEHNEEQTRHKKELEQNKEQQLSNYNEEDNISGVTPQVSATIKLATNNDSKTISKTASQTSTHDNKTERKVKDLKKKKDAKEKELIDKVMTENNSLTSNDKISSEFFSSSTVVEEPLTEVIVVSKTTSISTTATNNSNSINRRNKSKNKGNKKEERARQAERTLKHDDKVKGVTQSTKQINDEKLVGKMESIQTKAATSTMPLLSTWSSSPEAEQKLTPLIIKQGKTKAHTKTTQKMEQSRKDDMMVTDSIDVDKYNKTTCDEKDDEMKQETESLASQLSDKTSNEVIETTTTTTATAMKAMKAIVKEDSNSVETKKSLAVTRKQKLTEKIEEQRQEHRRKESQEQKEELNQRVKRDEIVLSKTVDTHSVNSSEHDNAIPSQETNDNTQIIVSTSKAEDNMENKVISVSIMEQLQNEKAQWLESALLHEYAGKTTPAQEIDRIDTKSNITVEEVEYDKEYSVSESNESETVLSLEPATKEQGTGIKYTLSSSSESSICSLTNLGMNSLSRKQSFAKPEENRFKMLRSSHLTRNLSSASYQKGNNDVATQEKSVLLSTKPLLSLTEALANSCSPNNRNNNNIINNKNNSNNVIASSSSSSSSIHNVNTTANTTTLTIPLPRSKQVEELQHKLTKNKSSEMNKQVNTSLASEKNDNNTNRTVMYESQYQETHARGEHDLHASISPTSSTAMIVNASKRFSPELQPFTTTSLSSFQHLPPTPSSTLHPDTHMREKLTAAIRVKESVTNSNMTTTTTTSSVNDNINNNNNTPLSAMPHLSEAHKYHFTQCTNLPNEESNNSNDNRNVSYEPQSQLQRVPLLVNSEYNPNINKDDYTTIIPTIDEEITLTPLLEERLSSGNEYNDNYDEDDYDLQNIMFFLQNSYATEDSQEEDDECSHEHVINIKTIDGSSSSSSSSCSSRSSISSDDDEEDDREDNLENKAAVANRTHAEAFTKFVTEVSEELPQQLDHTNTVTTNSATTITTTINTSINNNNNNNNNYSSNLESGSQVQSAIKVSSHASSVRQFNNSTSSETALAQRSEVERQALRSHNDAHHVYHDSEPFHRGYGFGYGHRRTHYSRRGRGMGRGYREYKDYSSSSENSRGIVFKNNYEAPKAPSYLKTHHERAVVKESTTSQENNTNNTTSYNNNSKRETKTNASVSDKAETGTSEAAKVIDFSHTPTSERFTNINTSKSNEVWSVQESDEAEGASSRTSPFYTNAKLTTQNESRLAGPLSTMSTTSHQTSTSDQLDQSTSAQSYEISNMEEESHQSCMLPSVTSHASVQSLQTPLEARNIQKTTNVNNNIKSRCSESNAVASARATHIHTHHKSSPPPSYAEASLAREKLPASTSEHFTVKPHTITHHQEMVQTNTKFAMSTSSADENNANHTQTLAPYLHATQNSALASEQSEKEQEIHKEQQQQQQQQQQQYQRNAAQFTPKFSAIEEHSSHTLSTLPPYHLQGHTVDDSNADKPHAAVANMLGNVTTSTSNNTTGVGSGTLQNKTTNSESTVPLLPLTSLTTPSFLSSSIPPATNTQLSNSLTLSTNAVMPHFAISNNNTNNTNNSNSNNNKELVITQTYNNANNNSRQGITSIPEFYSKPQQTSPSMTSSLLESSNALKISNVDSTIINMAHAIPANTTSSSTFTNLPAQQIQIQQQQIQQQQQQQQVIQPISIARLPQQTNMQNVEFLTIPNNNYNATVQQNELLQQSLLAANTPATTSPSSLVSASTGYRLVPDEVNQVHVQNNNTTPQQMMLVQLGDGRLALCPVVVLQGNQPSNTVNVMPSVVQLSNNNNNDNNNNNNNAANTNKFNNTSSINNISTLNPMINNTNIATFVQPTAVMPRAYEIAPNNMITQQGNTFALNSLNQSQSAQAVELARNQQTTTNSQFVTTPYFAYLPNT